jgi:hypothetical protein
LAGVLVSITVVSRRSLLPSSTPTFGVSTTSSLMALSVADDGEGAMDEAYFHQMEMQRR